MSYPKLTGEDISVLTEFFQFVDTDHDGFITVAEIKVACGVDINGDGTVSEEEAVKGAAGWLNEFLNQDMNADQKVSLAELLEFNNSLKS